LIELINRMPGTKALSRCILVVYLFTCNDYYYSDLGQFGEEFSDR